MKEIIFNYNNIDYKIIIGENRYDNWNIIDKSELETIKQQINGI